MQTDDPGLCEHYKGTIITMITHCATIIPPSCHLSIWGFSTSGRLPWQQKGRVLAAGVGCELGQQWSGQGSRLNIKIEILHWEYGLI